MSEGGRNPVCPRCAGAAWKLGFNEQGRQRYLCRDCQRTFTDATARRLARRGEREEARLVRQRAERLRRARTLAEFVGVLDPQTEEAIARSPVFGEMVRRAEFARRNGVSREYVRRLVKDKRLFTIFVGGVEWVSAREL